MIDNSLAMRSSFAKFSDLTCLCRQHVFSKVIQVNIFKSLCYVVNYMADYVTWYLFSTKKFKSLSLPTDFTDFLIKFLQFFHTV